VLHALVTHASNGLCAGAALSAAGVWHGGKTAPDGTGLTLVELARIVRLQRAWRSRGCPRLGSAKKAKTRKNAVQQVDSSL
jgi:hypothetical protein